MQSTADVIIIGSGLGGLVAGALLARYGRRVIVCESHTVPGGAAHAFTRQASGQRFTFDSGPSFYCGLADAASANPLSQVLAVLGEKIEAIPYDPFGYYHFPEGTLPVSGDGEKYRQAVEKFSPGAAVQLAALEARLLKIYAPLRAIPTLALRADLGLLPLLLQHYPKELAKILPILPDLGRSMAEIMAEVMDQAMAQPVSSAQSDTKSDTESGAESDKWLKRLLDLECFLLSGMTCQETVAPEMAFMFGERSHTTIDYPIGGSGAIVDALVRGLRRWGGELRLGAHVEKIVTAKEGSKTRVKGVLLKRNVEASAHENYIAAPIVISNATLWDTYTHLLDPSDLPSDYRARSLETPAVDSFMHLHLGIRAEGLKNVAIHHVVVHNSDAGITAPGNTCMVSIPTVLDPQQASPGHHSLHAYTLEPYQAWEKWSGKGKKDEHYEQKKREKAENLFRAVERIIPDVKERLVLEMIGTPLTHSRFLRRHQGTYGPAIAADEGRFPSCKTPIQGLYRVGDSTLPGIGVPAVAASGILCANSLVTLKESAGLLDLLAQQIAL
jgi:phytoene dehydrogenase-like protein